MGTAGMQLTWLKVSVEIRSNALGVVEMACALGVVGMAGMAFVQQQAEYMHLPRCNFGFSVGARAHDSDWLTWLRAKPRR